MTLLWWTPPQADPFGDMDYPAARLELTRGHLDVAEALVTASVRRWPVSKQKSRILPGTVLATIHVKAESTTSLLLRGMSSAPDGQRVSLPGRWKASSMYGTGGEAGRARLPL